MDDGAEAPSPFSILHLSILAFALAALRRARAADSFIRLCRDGRTR